MDDFNFWWYIIAAVIYFITRGKKKKQANKPSRPGSENNPPPSRPKSFEDLLREITEGTSESDVEEPIQEPVVIEPVREPEKPKPQERDRNKRVFADDESKRIYEESIKMAEGADIEFAPNEHFKSSTLFRKEEQEKEKSFAAELMDGFDADEAKKAVIYSEIFNRKY